MQTTFLGIFLPSVRRNRKYDKITTTKIVIAGFKKGEVMEAIEKAENFIERVKTLSRNKKKIVAIDVFINFESCKRCFYVKTVCLFILLSFGLKANFHSLNLQRAGAH